MNEVVAIVMTHAEENNLRPLLAGTPIELLPFGGGARVIDFTLLNMATAGIARIVAPVSPADAILAHHIRSRTIRSAVSTPVVTRPGGVTAASSLGASLRFLDRRSHQVIVSTGKNVHRLDYAAVLAHHRASGADATLMSLTVPTPKVSPSMDRPDSTAPVSPSTPRTSSNPREPAEFHSGILVESNDRGRVVSVKRPSTHLRPESEHGADRQGPLWLSFIADSVVIEPDALVDLIDNAGPMHTFFDFVAAAVSRLDVGTHPPEGPPARDWYQHIGTIPQYWSAHQQFLNEARRDPDFLARLSPRSVYVGEGFDGGVTNSIVPAGFAFSGGRIRDTVIGENVRLGRRVWIQESVIHSDAEVDDGCTIRRGILARGARVTGRARVDPRRHRPGSQIVKRKGVTVVPRGVLVRGPAKIPRPGADLPLSIEYARATTGA